MNTRKELLKDIDTLTQTGYAGYEPDKGYKMLNWFVKKLNLLPDAITKKEYYVQGRSFLM